MKKEVAAEKNARNTGLPPGAAFCRPRNKSNLDCCMRRQGQRPSTGVYIAARGGSIGGACGTNSAAVAKVLTIRQKPVIQVV